MPKTKAELVKEVEQLTAALREKGYVDNAAAAASVDSATMVPVKNFGGTYVVYPYEFRGQSRRLELDVSGRKQFGSVPLEIWLDMERNTKLVSQGYIARTDQPLSNPNLVEDVEALYNSSTEKGFNARIESITNPNVLYKFSAFFEPMKNKDGKAYAATRAVRDRIFALTQVKWTDEEE